MAKYTTELRTICESYAGVEEPIEYSQIPAIIEAGRQGIFDFTYPIWDPAYKSVLETKIIKHYFQREIGMETYGAWKLKLDATMNEIMPLYNQLYQSTVLEFNPLYDVNYKRTHTGSGENNRTGSTTDTGTQSNTQTLNTQDAKTGDDTVLRTDDLQHKKTGTDTNTKTDNLTHKTTGTETTVESGSPETVVAHEGTDETSRTANERTYTDTQNRETDIADVDTTGLKNDTPQGGLPSTYASNTNYLTGWTKDTTHHDGKDFDSLTATGTSSETFTDIRTLNTTDTTTETLDKTEQLTHNTTQTDTGTETDQTSYNSTESDTGTETTKTTYASADAHTGTVSDQGQHSNTTESEENITTTDQYIEEVVGHMSGSYAKAILEFRETLINIDKLIIDELYDLFMLLW